MTRTTNQLQNSNQLFTSFVGTVVGSILIWYLGPSVQLGKHSPFAHEYVRAIAVGLLLLHWVFKYFIKDNLKSSDSKNPGGIKSMRMKSPSAQLPWYLLIGPHRSGKTAFIANSNIDFTLQQISDQSAGAGQSVSKSYDCWATPDNVIIDLPGSYLAASNATEAKESNQQWLELFNKKNGRKSVRGVLVTLPLSDLTERRNREEFAESLKLRIKELKDKFGRQLPFYFIVTKCDLLPGFMDFFNNSGTDELAQAWGITIPPLALNDSLVDVFTQRFNALIKRLNKQLIWRLHQEMGSFERVFIKDFPLQVERLKEMLIDILKVISGIQNTFSLQGVYLTSAIQHSSEEPAPQTLQTTNASQQALQIMQMPPMPSRSFFIRQFLAQGLFANNTAQNNRFWQHRPTVYALCASTIAVTIAFLGYDLFYGKGKDKAIEVASFNIVVPQDKLQETKVGDSLTIVG